MLSFVCLSETLGLKVCVCGWKTEENINIIPQLQSAQYLGKGLESVIPQRCVRCLSLELCQQEYSRLPADS